MLFLSVIQYSDGLKNEYSVRRINENPKQRQSDEFKTAKKFSMDRGRKRYDVLTSEKKDGRLFLFNGAL
jgi:hypothetical protein